MNERIKELITQARGHWNHGDFNMPKSVEFQEEDIEKFVELIVRDCANICDNFQARDVGMQPSECAGAIRHRFGVKG